MRRSERRPRNQSGRRRWRDLDAHVPQQLLETLAQLLERYLGRTLPERKPPTVDILTFADVVRYFSEEHPADLDIRAGALYRTAHPNGHLVFQVFLHGGDQISTHPSGVPHGRQLIARSLDPELTSKFSSGDLIIFR